MGRANESPTRQKMVIAGSHPDRFAFLALLVIVAILWLPFGLQNKPLVEEWLFLARFDRGANPLFAMASEPYTILRPLVPLSFYIPYAVSPDSLAGFNIFLALFTFLKGWLLYLCLRQLVPQYQMVAFLAATLFIVYPVDQGLFSLRAFNIQASVVFFFLALYALLRTQTHRGIGSIVVMLLSLIVCLGLYDAPYPLILVSPALLIIRGKGVSKKTIYLAVLWLLVPVAMLARQLFLMRTLGSAVYEVSVFSGSNLLTESVRSIALAYAENLITGWQAALALIDLASPLTYIAILTGAVGGVLCWFSLKRSIDTGDSACPGLTYEAILLIGFSAIGLGFALISLTEFRYDTWRVFMFSSAGSAVVVAVIISGLFARHRAVASVAVAILIGIAILSALNQHGQYAGYSEAAQQLVSDTVLQIPQLRHNAALIVINGPQPQPYQEWKFFHHGYLGDTLRYTWQDYDHLLNAEMCEVSLRSGQEQKHTQDAVSCEFNDTGVDVYHSGVLYGAYGFSQLVLFSYSPAHGYTLLATVPPGLSSKAEAYRPCELVGVSQALPRALGIWNIQTASPGAEPKCEGINRPSTTVF